MRNKKNAGGRRHDTRLTLAELCKVAGISVKQRVIMERYIKFKLKEGEHSD